MFALLAIALAQACYAYEGDYCAASVETPMVRATVVRAAQYEPNSNSGVSLISKRGHQDQSPDVTILLPIERVVDAPGIEMRKKVTNHVVFRVLQRGEVLGGGSQDSAASFIDMSTADGHVFGSCLPASGELGGCYITLLADMAPANAHAFHGLLTVGNARVRDGGIALQLHGSGKWNVRGAVYPGTITAIDDFGNLILRDGYIFQQARKMDQRPCQSTAVWDGEWRGPGGYSYVEDTGAIELCSPLSALDGGYETVCTDKNGACSVADRLAIIEARLTALETQ